MKIVIAERSKIEHKDLIEMYRNFFLHSPEGEIILQDLAANSGMFAVSSDPDEIRLKEGMRAMFLYLTSNLQDFEDDDVLLPDDNFKYS